MECWCTGGDKRGNLMNSKPTLFEEQLYKGRKWVGMGHSKTRENFMMEKEEWWQKRKQEITNQYY